MDEETTAELRSRLVAAEEEVAGSATGSTKPRNASVPSKSASSR